VRIFFTGGTGFFGKAVLRHLLAGYSRNLAGMPEQVMVLARSPERFLQQHPEFAGLPWLAFHTGNVEQPLSLPRGEHFSHVLHAAADSTDAARMSPLQRYDQIVNGTRHLLDFALASGAERFLFTSSGAVYGPQPPHLEGIPEEWHGSLDQLSPANAHGLAKRAAEHLCALYCQIHGLQATVARCFAFVGQDLQLDVHFAIGNFIRDALWRDAITVQGDGTALRSYLEQDDLAFWLLKLLAQGEGGRAYNVGSDQAISIGALAHLVRDLVAPGKPVQILGRAEHNAVPNRYLPNIERARRELGLSVVTPLDQAIRQTAIIRSQEHAVTS